MVLRCLQRVGSMANVSSLVLMNKGLHNFAYWSNVTRWLFTVARLVVGLVALKTVSFQALKAAISILVRSLRSEE